RALSSISREPPPTRLRVSSGEIGPRRICLSAWFTAGARSRTVSASVPSRSKPIVANGKLLIAMGSADRLWNAQAFGGIAATMSQKHNRPLAAIILAAGKGTRMKSARHKVLHPIAGRPMIEHLLASLQELSPARTIVVVGDGRDQIEQQLGDRAELVVQEPQLGTGHAVQQAEVALGGFEGDVLVLYADVPF